MELSADVMELVLEGYLKVCTYEHGHPAFSWEKKCRCRGTGLYFSSPSPSTRKLYIEWPLEYPSIGSSAEHVRLSLHRAYHCLLIGADTSFVFFVRRAIQQLSEYEEAGRPMVWVG